MAASALGDFAERCRVMIAQSFVMDACERVSATASIGATVLSQGDSAESAIRRVDELMDQSKRGGGDQTMAGWSPHSFCAAGPPENAALMAGVRLYNSSPFCISFDNFRRIIRKLLDYVD
jgi:hypothetical protein